MDAISIAVLPEFSNDEQLPASASRGGLLDLENVYTESVDLTRETVPVNRTLRSLCFLFPLGQCRTRPVDNEFDITNNP
jgi:hypothetical protein